MESIEAVLGALREDPSSEAAWVRFYQYYKPRLMLYLLRWGVHVEEAEDLVHQALYNFLARCPWRDDRWSLLPGPRTILAYLRTTAYHLLIDARRVSNRVDSLEAWLEAHPDREPVHSDQVRLLALEDIEWLKAGLTGEERKLLFHRLMGRTLAEIAQALGVAPSTAGVRIHRLMRKLRDRM